MITLKHKNRKPGTEDLEIEDLKIEDLKIEDLKIEDLKLPAASCFEC